MVWATPAQISGRIFSDADIDGEPDVEELGLAGLRVYADVNFNGVADPGEAQALTNADGHYLVTNVAPGDDIVVRVELPSSLTARDGDIGGGVGVGGPRCGTSRDAH